MRRLYIFSSELPGRNLIRLCKGSFVRNILVSKGESSRRNLPYSSSVGYESAFKRREVGKDVHDKSYIPLSIDPRVLEELELSIGTLASIYLKPVRHVFRLAKPRKLTPSPCLIPRRDNDVDELKQLAEQAEKSKQPAPSMPDIASLSLGTLQSPSLSQYAPLVPTPNTGTPTTPSFPQMPQRSNSVAVHHQSQQLLDDGSGSQGYFVTQNGIAQGSQNTQNLLW